MDRKRTYEWENPMIGASQALKLSGYDYLKAMTEGKLPMPPIMKTLDYTAGVLEKGKVTFIIEPKEYHYNPIGCVHGGVISTILDTVMGCAVHSLLPAGFGYSTLELKINFIKQVRVETGKLMAIGSVIHKGKQTAVAEASLIDQEGKVYAQGTSTCLILNFNQ